MLKRAIVFLGLLCALAAPASADTPATGFSAPGLVVDQVRTESGIEVQDVTYVSEGLRVKAFLFTSPVPGRRPAIVFNHGGVSGVSRDMMRRSADLARAGYMVITPTYRGEGGSEGRIEVADGEVADVLNAADILRGHPRVDPNRMGLVGSSHGALVSVLAATRDSRFRAVAAACGVMDVVAWYRYLVANGFDVSDSLSIAVYGHGPEDRPEAFRKRNAVLVAPKLRPALLLQQGLTDRIVPPDQPWRMASALQRAGHNNHQVLTYPLLGHAFWFWNDTKSHTVAEVNQAEESWNDLLSFLKTHLEPERESSGTAMGQELVPVPDPAPPSTPYEAGIREWQKQRAERLLADDGWLTVAGLFWLREGDNRFGADHANEIVMPSGSAPAEAGFIRVRGDEVTLHVEPGMPVFFDGKPVTEVLPLTSDYDGPPMILSINDVRFHLIKRSKGYAIRMRHLNAPARRDFKGIETFPVDTTWKVEARFVPYNPPKPVEIPNIIGTVDTMLAPGYLEFVRDGDIHRLDPVLESAESEDLFLIFKDATSGVTTYPPGRFLYTSLPVDGRVTIDFNRAYNPPCAFTDFATCPLPPEQNELKVAVTAGEKDYGGHANAHSSPE